MSSISLSVEFGKKVKLMRVTLFSFTTSAFFQSEVNKLGPLQKLSPIVGLKVNGKKSILVRHRFEGMYFRITDNRGFNTFRRHA